MDDKAIEDFLDSLKERGVEAGEDAVASLKTLSASLRQEFDLAQPTAELPTALVLASSGEDGDFAARLADELVKEARDQAKKGAEEYVVFAYQIFVKELAEKYIVPTVTEQLRKAFPDFDSEDILQASVTSSLGLVPEKIRGKGLQKPLEKMAIDLSSKVATKVAKPGSLNVKECQKFYKATIELIYDLFNMVVMGSETMRKLMVQHSADILKVFVDKV